MDPVTQGVLGAVASQNSATKRNIIIATFLGILSGMAADLDVFIRSETDPMMFLEYHRQFTHSLIFIPIGGLICSLVFQWLLAKRWQLRFKTTYLYCTAGYATHALLDACTSYGTQLFWPFSDVRVSWNTISIIDPFFTIPLLVLIITAAMKRKSHYAKIAAAWVLIYMSLGIIQRERAEIAGWEVAASRGHEPVRLEAKPGFGSNLMWKIVYEVDNQFYVDGFKLGINSKHYPGDAIKKLEIEEDFPWLDPSSQQARDVERFRWFSDDFLAIHPENPNRIIDIRYSMIPNRIDAFWMIEIQQNISADQHAAYFHEHSDEANDAMQYWDMIWN